MAVSEDRRNIMVGGATMLALAAIVVTVHFASARQKAEGYELTARFHKAEGVAVGSEVRLGGVVVGQVTRQALDDRFRAVLTLRLSPKTLLPADSNAAIQTDGLLGGKFIALQPGGDEANLKPGGEIAYTQDSLAVEDLLAMIIAQAEAAHGIKNDSNDKGAADSSPRQ